MNVIVSFTISTPPLKNTSLLSKFNSLLLSPSMGCKTHPLPLPPVRDMLWTWSISNSCGSTNTSFTVPTSIGSAAAPIPLLVSIPIIGGFKISYPLPPFNKSTDSNEP